MFTHQKMINNIKIHSNAKVIFKGREINATELNNMVEKICKSILKLGGCNAAIGICLKRNEWVAPAIFACLKLGIPYVPLHKELPQNRMMKIANDCKMDYILVDDSTESAFNKEIMTINVNHLDKFAGDKYCVSKSIGSGEIAYVMYTSGTTGTPKGVMVLRSSLLALFEGIDNCIELNRAWKFGFFTDISFDISILEIVYSLHRGHCVVMGAEEEIENPRLLGKCIEHNSIQILQFTPTRIQQISYVDESFLCLKGVRILLVGGEKLETDLLKKLCRKTRCRIFNMYGPTETTVWSTISELTNKTHVDIGKPIKGTGIFILDKNKKLKPKGEVGEIGIYGKGVALGYINDPILTQKKFCDIEGQKVYRTGDLGYVDEYDNIICIGRRDEQIKINGKRVELAEIEHNICLVSGIISSKVIYMKENSSYKIIAYYVAEREIEREVFQEFLKKELPGYMIPNKFIKVNSIPANKNGKMDKKKLEELGIDQEKEKIFEFIQKMFKEKLNYEDTFLSAGANSLDIIKIYTQIEKTYGFEFELKKLRYDAFKNIGELVDYIFNQTR